jgi:hypothetical protein
MRFLRSIFNLLRFNKKNWKAIALCFFAATIFWFFNALNKSYTTNINFPLAFDYRQESYLPVETLPTEVRINVSGIGWNLFRRSSGIKVPPLVIPLDRPSEVKKIVGSTLPGFFSNQLEGLEINFVVTDTLYLNIQPKANRWLRLSLDSIQKNLNQNYAIAGKVKLVPESVFVEGPVTLITKLEEPVRLKVNEQNINENFRQDIEIDLANSDLILYNPSTVSVAFDIEKFVRITDSVRLELRNIPPRSNPWIEVSKIPCTFAIRESMIKDFKPDSVKAVLDLKGFKRGELKLVPTLIGLPENSQVIKIDSIRISLLK